MIQMNNNVKTFTLTKELKGLVMDVNAIGAAANLNGKAFHW